MKKKIFLRFIISFVIVASYDGKAEALGRKSKFENMSLGEIADQALANALDTQVTVADQNYLVGEFPTEIQSTLVPVIAGVGKLFGQDQEASAFTTASVVNVLAQTYLNHQDRQARYLSLGRIPKAIENGVRSFERYASGSVFNFYPPHIENGVQVRRPIDMELGKIWFGFTNIPNDADTSSVALSAQLFNSQINKKDQFKVSDESFAQFSRFRDLNRKPMFYNKRQKREQTGAFMTWLYDENNPQMPRFFFAKAERGERIPFNKNDVDCVVNANVIKLTALAKKTDLEGYKEACEMINDMVKEDEHAYCGVYYPNTYNLAFAMSAAEKAGDQCLSKNSKQLIIDKILSLQDGYTGAWANDRNIWEDKVLSTAFAMQALLQFANPREYKVYVALLYGTHFLLNEIQYKKGPIIWPADNFFTATAVARSLIMWRSEAYTNAMISDVLFEMEKQFSQFKAENYLKLNFN